MVVADVRRRLFQRRDQLRVAGVVRIVQHLRLDNVRLLAVKPLGVFHDRIPAALLYVRHHTADNLLNIAARTSRTGFISRITACSAVPSAFTIFRNICCLSSLYEWKMENGELKIAVSRNARLLNCRPMGGLFVAVRTELAQG